MVEILVVCAIIGIVMTMSIPMLYHKLHPDSMQRVVSDMMEACSHARASAILNSSPVDLVLRAGNAGEEASISIQPAAIASPMVKPDDVDSPSVSGENWRMGDRHSPPRAISPDVAGNEWRMGDKPISHSANTPISFTAKIPDSIAIELMELNFQDAMEYEEVRVRFYPNGTSDEFRCLLYRPASNERRLITLDVVTGLADLETDIMRMKLK